VASSANTPIASTDIDATAFNDTIPRAIASTIGATSKIGYLVIKSTRAAAMTKTDPSLKWSYMHYSSSATGANLSYIKVRKAPDVNWSNGTNIAGAPADRAIMVRSTFSTHGDITKQLVVKGSTKFFDFTNTNLVTTGGTTAFALTLAADNVFKPTSPTLDVLVYGIGSVAPRIPYNRIDYYVDLTAPKPAVCSPGTGVLFKAVLDNSTGGTGGTFPAANRYPLLDCVGDMQVIFNLDMDEDGNPKTTSNADASGFISTETTPPLLVTPVSQTDIQTTLGDASLLRKRLKVVKVFILTQEGKMDKTFSYPPIDPTNAIFVGPYSDGGVPLGSVGRMWTQANMLATFGSNWRNYRWKVYSIVVGMKNIEQ
jgi:hypothetical protein